MTFKIKQLHGHHEVQIGPFKSLIFPEHFCDLDDAGRRLLFKNSVQHVVLELSASCNRRCKFCPNSDGKRYRNNDMMPDDVFNLVINNLATIDYDNIIYWHLYNEPLAQISLLSKRMRVAREELKGACFALNTNGDYLDLDLLYELEESGLNKIFVSIYGKSQGEWQDDYIRSSVIDMRNTIKLKNELRQTPGIEYSVSGRIGNVDVTIAGRNIWDTGYDRGGLIPALSVTRRTSPCLSAFTEFLVDHRGYVLPCCNVYTDQSDHITYTACSMSEIGIDIFKAYAGTSMQQWRKSLLQFNPPVKFCAGCSRGELPSENTPENNKELKLLIDELCPTN